MADTPTIIAGRRVGDLKVDDSRDQNQTWDPNPWEVCLHLHLHALSRRVNEAMNDSTGQSQF